MKTIAPAPFAVTPVLGPAKVKKIRADEGIAAVVLLLLVCVSTLTSPIPEAWVTSLTKAGVLCLASIWILQSTWKERPITVGRSFVFVGGIALLGMVQLVAHVTVYRHATRESITYWGTLCCAALLASTLCRERAIRRWILSTLVFLTFGLAMFNMSAIAGAVDLRVAADLPAWKSIGLFASSNQCAELVELALPVALARTLLDRKRWIFYGFVSAVLFATVLGCRSRMGSLLVTAEVIAVLWLGRRDRLVSRRHWVRVAALVLLLAAGMSLVVGVGGLFARLQDRNPLSGRRELFAATLHAAAQRPFTGYGLGTFSEIYPSFAVVDLGGMVKHAHDEWLEAVCDGGVLMLILLLLAFAAVVRPAARSLWGLGLLAVLLHAAVDFPLERMSIALWTFVLMGAVEGHTRTKVDARPGTGLASEM
ncbi:MAG TPA: O-antigen ligase family protein [Bryobacteraceae bacterium]|nr:O-antigen ligase family protein [Bryobacteraceae bacterium]